MLKHIIFINSLLYLYVYIEFKALCTLNKCLVNVYLKKSYNPYLETFKIVLF